MLPWLDKGVLVSDRNLGLPAKTGHCANAGTDWPCNIAVLFCVCNAIPCHRDAAEGAECWCCAERGLVACSANLGGLDIVEGWLEGETEVYRFVTKPDLDKFVPKRLQKHFKEGGLQYTDIIRYDPAKISQPPFVLDVTSIPPILAERVFSPPHQTWQ